MSDMPNIDIRPDHWEIVRDILRKHVPQNEAWAFGSRAKWTAKTYSDLDLAVITDKPLPIQTSANLSEAFSNSDLPWKVDVVDWATTGESFRKIIERDQVVVQKASGLGAPSNWREVSLGDVSDVITGYPFKSQYYSDNADDPRLIGGDNIAQGNLRWENIRRWPLSMTKGLDHYWLKPGDVVLAMDRPWIDAGLKRAAVGESDVPSLLVQRTARLRGTDELDTAFLRYLVSCQAFTQYILSVQTGTAVPHISPTQIREFRFRLPPVKEQCAIAKVLGSLDDNIALLRRSNETLEAIARALYRSWFVDFDPVIANIDGRKSLSAMGDIAAEFSSSFDESPNGRIPSGWSYLTLGDVVEILDSRRVPLSSSERRARSGNYPYYGATSIMDYVDDYLFDGTYLLMGEDGSVINKDGTPVLQYVWGKFWVNNHAHVMRGRGGICTEHIFLFLQEFSVYPYVTGAVQPKINQANMKRIPFLVPTATISRLFESRVLPIFEMIKSNTEKLRVIENLRDFLLPKLVGGEFSTKGLEL